AVFAAVAPFGAAEVVLVDSRSTDPTLEIARAYPVRIVELADSAPLSPALGRFVGERLTSSRYVLFVDGDTEVEGPWLRAAIEFLEANPQVAGLCGKLRELYYEEGRIVGEEADCYHAGAAPTAVSEVGGNALYRRSALNAAGSFNPLLASYEETELAERLHQSGFSVMRLPIRLGTHRTGQRGSLKELARRYRENLIRGYGQALRLSLGTPMFWPHVRRMKRYLQFQASVVAGVISAVATALTLNTAWFAAWVSVFIMATLAFMVRSRSITKPFLLYVDWAVWSGPLILGFAQRPRDPRTLVLEDLVAWTEHPAERAAGRRAHGVG